MNNDAYKFGELDQQDRKFMDIVRSLESLPDPELVDFVTHYLSTNKNLYRKLHKLLSQNMDYGIRGEE